MSIGMPKPKFSISTIMALVEVVTGGPGYSTTKSIGIYRSASKLESILGRANIDFQKGQFTSRMPAVKDVLRKVNSQPYGEQHIARLIGLVTDPAENDGDLAKAMAVVEYLNRCLKTDGYIIRLVNNHPQLLKTGEQSTLVAGLRRKAETLDLDSVNRNMDKALAKADDDPDGALTAACSALESVCKCLLEELGQPLPNKQDVTNLVQAVQRVLNLAPERKDINEDVRRILGGLTTVAGGIGSLRTHGGDAHGRGRAAIQVDARIARLAIHAASTLSVFLIETWERNQKNG